MGGAQIDQYGNINTSVVGQRLLEAEGPAARHRRRQRHRLAVPRGVHPHRAREAPVRSPRGFRDQPGVARAATAPAPGRPALRRRLARGDHARHLRLRARDAAHAHRGDAPRRHASSRSATTPASRSARSSGWPSPSRPATTSWRCCARSTPSAASSARGRASRDPLRPRHQELRRPHRDARHRRALSLLGAGRGARLRVAVGVGPRHPRRGAVLPHPRRRRHADRHRRAHVDDQARHRRAGAAAAQPHGGRQGHRHAGRHQQGPADPRRGRRLVRAGVRRRRRAVQAARPAVRAQLRDPHAAVDRGPGDAAGRRVQPARGRHAPEAGAAPAPADPDRRLRRRRAQARGHEGRRLADLLLHAGELHARRGRRSSASPARPAAIRRR